jgi:hypothetical protein
MTDRPAVVTPEGAQHGCPESADAEPGTVWYPFASARLRTQGEIAPVTIGQDKGAQTHSKDQRDLHASQDGGGSPVGPCALKIQSR